MDWRSHHKYVMTLFAWQRYRYENEEISVVDRSRHSVDPLTPTGKIETSQNHIIVKISPISELQNTLFYKISHWIGLMTKIHMNRPKDPRQQSTKVEKKIENMSSQLSKTSNFFEIGPIATKIRPKPCGWAGCYAREIYCEFRKSCISYFPITETLWSESS